MPQDAFEFIGDATALLSSSLDYEETLRAVTWLAVPRLADWCFVDLLDEAGDLKAVAVANTSPEMLRRAREFSEKYPRNMDEREGMPNVVRTGKPELYFDIVAEIVVPTGGDLEKQEDARRCGFCAAALLPLIARGRILGGMGFGSYEPGKYGEGELRLFEVIAKHAAVAVDNAILYRQAQDELAARIKVEAELELRVRNRTADLITAYQQLESFSYAVSHDLRAPLRSINAAARMLLEEHGEGISEDGERELHRIADSSLRMSSLIDNLLEYSRIGSKKIEKARVDLADLAQSVVDELVGVAYEAGSVSVLVQKDMVADADPVLMRVALQNLLENALKFSRDSTHPTVEIGQRNKGPRTFFVRDNGVGFDAATALKLFEPFERFHDTAKYPGSGIGLANVKRVIEKHGGRVWAEGEPGHGATFYFTL